MAKLMILIVGSLSGFWASAQNITFTEAFTVERSADLSLLGTRLSFLKAARDAKAAALALCQSAHYSCAAPFVTARECKAGLFHNDCAVIARVIGSRQVPLGLLARISSQRCTDLSPYDEDLHVQYARAEDSTRAVITQIFADQQSLCERQRQRDSNQGQEAPSADEAAR